MPPRPQARSPLRPRLCEAGTDVADSSTPPSPAGAGVPSLRPRPLSGEAGNGSKPWARAAKGP